MLRYKVTSPLRDLAIVVTAYNPEHARNLVSELMARDDLTVTEASEFSTPKSEWYTVMSSVYHFDGTKDQTVSVVLEATSSKDAMSRVKFNSEMDASDITRISVRKGD